MCFRPTAVKKENPCPKCGTVNEDAATVCKECGADLPKMPAPPGAPGAPGGPKAPAAPKAPGMPNAPKAAPKAPGQE
ncbi:MAG: zinc ribbon domain-containing protein [Coriobacteriia bacterium]